MRFFITGEMPLLNCNLIVTVATLALSALRKLPSFTCPRGHIISRLECRGVLALRGLGLNEVPPPCLSECNIKGIDMGAPGRSNVVYTRIGLRPDP